ncbi:hypothetical protein GSI_09441 [Ganoderma sinense ZZ0214-1]|uniref:Extracellular mutant protein 11 C-terminal domain-containing protein n=1 Tax=Ganoderma sinense ZZ0214-1 TaxID=1077348 RepID=A0A2G8S6I2_9APHY|nr:hypothetical protein GSI_09441 [Ganoderma sinense ZZ0214-1]
MSARAPFVPRPASRMDVNSIDKDQSPASPPATAYEPFRANGLLSADAQAHIPGEHPPKALDTPPHPPPAKFKPLNLSGLGKLKNSPQPRQPHLQLSFDNSNPNPRSPKSLPPGQQKHFAATQPSSPFFPNTGLVSMNAFRAPLIPAHTRDSPENDSFSSNKAHIVPSINTLTLNNLKDMQDKPPSVHESGSFRFLDSSSSGRRSRTASHPSLASIHEVEEENDNTVSRTVQPMGPPPPPPLDNFGAEYLPGDFLGSSQQDEQLGQSLHRPMKRSEPTLEDGEDYEYGTDPKRYKLGLREDEYPPIYSGRSTPRHYSEPALGHTPHGPPKVVGNPEPKQALYQLLGQDLDIWVEAHADVYEQARKKWSECSMEEWTKGADDLAVRFSKLIDFVKDHMSAKLSLYASIQNTISQHKGLLSTREKALVEARECLVREGGAVVGERLNAVNLGDENEKES